jgi:PAS domain S-box-containing protein
MPDFALRTGDNAHPNGWPGIPYLGLFGLSYVAAAWLGQSLSLLPGTAALLWLPNGLSVAVLLYCQSKAWPRLIATLVVAEIVGDILLFKLPLPVGMALALGNGTEVLIGAWLVRRACGTPYAFQSLRDTLALVVFAAGMAPLPGAVIGSLTFWLAGIAPLADTWPLWWLNDAVGILVAAPPALIILQGRAKWLAPIQTRWPEMLALLAALVAAALIVFGSSMPIFPLLLPVLLWAGLRFGISGAAMAMAVITAVAIASTASGSGPFAGEAYSVAERVQLLHAFLGVCAVSTLVSAALIQQRWTDLQTLKLARDELERLVVQRTDALKQSEDRFLGVAGSVPGVVFQWSERADGTYGFTYASPRMAEYFKVPADRPDEALRLIHPDDVVPFRASIEAAKKTLSPWRFEGRFLDAGDQSLRWWRGLSQVVSANEKEILFNGVLFDVTEEKQTERALADSVRQMNLALQEQRALLAASPAGISTLDAHRVITSANDAMVRMFGYEPGEFIGKSTRELFVSGAQWSDIGSQGYEQMCGRGIYRAEVQYRRKDGSTFWGLLQGVQLDPADASRGRLFAIVDISRQKDAENEARSLGEALERRVLERTTELLQSESRMRSMLALSADWYWEQDADLRFTKVIGDAAPLNQLGVDSFVGKTRWDLPILGVNELQWAEHRKTLDTHQTFRNFICQYRYADGSLRTLSTSGEPVFGEDGGFVGYRGIGSDITEVSAMAARFRQSDERFQALLSMSEDWYWEQDEEHRFTLHEGLAGAGPAWVQGFYLGKARWELSLQLLGGETWENHRALLDARRPFKNLLVASLAWDGKTLIASVNGKPRFDEQGRFLGYHGTARDVTEREAMLEALRDSRRRLDLALKGSELTLWDWDLKSGQVFLDEQWAVFLGKPPGVSNVTITELQALMHPDDAPLVFAVLGQTLKGERPYYEVEHRVRTASGKWKWIYSHAMVTERNAEGWALRMTGTNADIDARKQAEEQASELLRGLKAVFAASPAGIFTVDSERRITLATGAMEKMFGYEARGMTGLSTREIVASREAWEWIGTEGYRQIRERGIMSREIEYRRVDGGRFWGLLQGVQIDPRRSDSENMFVVMDINEIRQARETLRATTERLSAIVRYAPVAIFSVLPDGTVTSWNPAAEEIFGWSETEAVGRYLPMVRDEIRSKADALRARAMAGESMHGLELTRWRRDGSEVPLEMSVGPLFDAGGKLTGTIVIALDITLRKRAENELRRSEARFRALLELSVDWYWEQDAQFRFTRIQGPASPLRHLDPDHVLGKTRWELPAHGVSEEQWAEHRNLLSAHQPFRDFNYRILDSDGKESVVSISGEPTFDETGRFTGYRGVGTDITPMVHAADALRASEEKIRQLNADLERRVQERTRRLTAANRELEAFGYSVSHDLQAPLRRIGRYAELLSDRAGKALDEPAREMLTSIRLATEHTRDLIGDIMKLSKITQSELAPAKVNVSNLAAAVLAELAGTGEARAISTEVTAGIEVEADAALLRILLDNLLGNAWKFTARTENARIEVRKLEVSEGRGFLVRDNGAGFDMRYAYKLFGSFQRLHSQDEFKGTGIGLAIVQRIVNLHGWTIEAEAEVGKGATFKVKTS